MGLHSEGEEKGSYSLVWLTLIKSTLEVAEKTRFETYRLATAQDAEIIRARLADLVDDFKYQAQGERPGERLENYAAEILELAGLVDILPKKLAAVDG